MDALSEVVGTFHAGQAAIRRMREAGRWGFRLASFPGIGFHVVLRGPCWLVTEVGQPVCLQPGDIALIPHGIAHGLGHAPMSLAELPLLEVTPDPLSPIRAGACDEEAPADADLLCGAYRLGEGRPQFSLETLPEVIHLSAGEGRHPGLRAIIELLKADTADDLPGASASTRALIDLFVVHTFRAWEGEALDRHPTADWAAISDPGIASALQQIHDHPELPWSVQRLSASAGMSRTAFTRRFTSLVGRPPMAYVIGWRLNYGARLLRETGAPIGTVARQVGYRSEFAFASAFRREFGIPPGQFRKTA